MNRKNLAYMVVLIFVIGIVGFSTNTVQGQGGQYELEFWYSPSHYGDQEADVADLIAAQLEDTGYFDVNIQSAEWSQYLEMLPTMGFFLLGWWPDYPDPSNYIDPFVGAGAFALGSNYSSDTMDGYINTMLTETDDAARTQATIDAQNLMAEDVPIIPLFSMLNQFSAFHSHISGYTLEPIENVHYDTIVDSSSDTDVVIGVTDSLTGLDPSDVYDFFSSNMLVQLTHGLMETPRDSLDAQLGPIAESVTSNDAGTEYTFTLKQGIKFSDGTDFNATAMVWNINRVLDLDASVGTDPGFLLSDVVDTVEETGDYEIKFTLSKADATFLARLTYTVAWPMSPASLAYDEIQGQPETIPAGLGPYMVESWTAGNEIILVPNPNYFGDAPANDRVVVQFFSDASALLTALEAEEIDIAQKEFGPAERDSIKSNADLEWVEQDPTGVRYIIVNVEMHTDKLVRQAISKTIDRAEITETAYSGQNTPIFSMVPDFYPSSVDAYSMGTLDEVASLMEEAGYSTGGGPLPFSNFTTILLASISTVFLVNVLRRRKD